MAVSRNFAALISPFLTKVYVERYKKNPFQMERYLHVESSKRAYEQGIGVVGFGLVPERREGKAVIMDDPMQGYAFLFGAGIVALIYFTVFVR